MNVKSVMPDIGVRFFIDALRGGLLEARKIDSV
jgi:hypothetical protein